MAQTIVDKVRKHPTNPGKLTLADLAGLPAPANARADLPRPFDLAARSDASAAFATSSALIAVGQILGILAHQRRRRCAAAAGGVPNLVDRHTADWLHCAPRPAPGVRRPGLYRRP